MLGDTMTSAESWRMLGYWLLIAGLVGTIAVLALPARTGRTAKILSVIFAAILAAGFAIEHRANHRIFDLIAQHEALTAQQIAALEQAAATANERAGELQSELARQAARRMTPEAGTAARDISDKQRDQLKSAVRPGAKVSIIALTGGEPEAFARALADALAKAGAETSFATSSAPLNGDAGLLVTFNHHNAVSRSVFDALDQAWLGPKDMDDTHGTPVVVIKVGPKPGP